MELNDYSNLKEIYSLDNMIKTHLDKISDEQGRITFLEKKRKQKDQELEELRKKKKDRESQINQFEVSLFDFEKKLQSSIDHIPMATSEKEAIALQNEIDTLTPEIDAIQEKSLELLDTLELIENEIEQLSTFLSGSKETLGEVQKEVEAIRNAENIPIKQYQDRINLLLENTPSKLSTIFLKIREQYRYKQPIVRIINHACEFCHYQIDQIALERVESLQGIEICGQCGRLFIPLES